jgi:hypothetical protein
MDALRPVVVTHPLSTLTAEQLDARAHEAAPLVRAVWEGTTGPAALDAGRAMG